MASRIAPAGAMAGQCAAFGPVRRRFPESAHAPVANVILSRGWMIFRRTRLALRAARDVQSFVPYGTTERNGGVGRHPQEE